jgi:uncharacterized protein
MNSSLEPAGRVRSFGYFIIALIYFVFAKILAGRAANGLVSGDWQGLVEQMALLFLLLLGYWAMGKVFENQRKPIEEMGLVVRAGAAQEFGIGAALGWGMMIASILPMVLTGGLIVSVWTTSRQFVLLLLNLLVLALAALAEEIAFRGYPFQRLIEALGPTLATLTFSAIFGLMHLMNPGATRGSTVVTMLAGWLLSVGYLRTRALWLPWGWHFAWNASMSLLFGLPLSGLTRFSPVIQSNTIGPDWITGGNYGPEGSLVTGAVLLIGLIVTIRVTRGYAYKYAQPVIVSGGAPVNLDAMGHVLAPHHQNQTPPAGDRLVQISSPNSNAVTAPAPKAPHGADSHVSGEGADLENDVPSSFSPAELDERERTGASDPPKPEN